MRKLIFYFLLLVVISAFGYYFSPHAVRLVLDLGLMGEQVSVSGTGSMYPTFPKAEGVTDKEAQKMIVATPLMYRYPGGINLFGRQILNKKIQHGDIVEFENGKTDKITQDKYGGKTGFVKRVIGLAGDEIELRDGYVYLNGEILTESYTAKPRSTYGGENIADCKKVIVPNESVAVLGDNRKASLDSRFDLGFINLNDINYVLSYENQSEYKIKWRDTTDDFKIAHTVTADPEEFVNSLNAIRTEKNLPVLKLNPLLNQSGQIRGQAMLVSNNGLSLEMAVKNTGYRNILIAELYSKGFYESQELLENLFEFPDSENLLLNPQYQDIGLSAVLSDAADCPEQVIVIHLGGYKPPDYQKKDIESWRLMIESISEILPSWKNLTAADGIDQNKLKELISVLEERLNNGQKIYQRLLNNEWLTDQEQELINKDSVLHKSAEKLITELNR